MTKLSRKFMLAGMMSLTPLSIATAQETENPTPEKPKSGLIYKGMAWGLTDANIPDPTVNLLSANIFKHQKSKGFGVMALAVTQPTNIGQEDKPIVPLVSMLAHWGNKNLNVNIGPTSKLNGGPLVDGFRGIVNLNGQNESRLGARLIIDTDKDLKRATNVAAHIRYKIAQNLETTIGTNTKGNVQFGLSMNY